MYVCRYICIYNELIKETTRQRILIKKEEIPHNIRDQCIGLSKGGHGFRDIARTLNLASSTVSFIVRRWQNTGSTNSFKSPKMITTRGARQLKSIVKHNLWNTLRGITEIYNDAKDQRVSSKTVSTALHKMGF